MNNMMKEIRELMELDDQERRKYSRNNADFFKISKGQNLIRVLPLREDNQRSVLLVREHWVIKKEDELQKKFVCPKNGCIICEAVEYIYTKLHDGTISSEAEKKYYETLIFPQSEKEFPKIGRAKLVWYMSILDMKENNNSPMIWGCSQISIQKALQEIFVEFPDFFDLKKGFNLKITREDPKYLVTNCRPTDISAQVNTRDIPSLSRFQKEGDLNEMEEVVTAWMRE